MDCENTHFSANSQKNMKKIWNLEIKTLNLQKLYMITTIILTIYCIIILLMLLVKNETSILAKYAGAGNVFNAHIPFTFNTGTLLDDCTHSKVTKSQHLTCQFTRAGTLLRHSAFKPGI
jgi:hypothetical protein